MRTWRLDSCTARAIQAGRSTSRTCAGQDSDCNPSSAAGLLGGTIGYDRIPDEWKRGIPAIAARTLAFTSYSFNDIVMSTTRRTEAVTERSGGRVDGDALVSREQSAVPPPLEQWDMPPVFDPHGGGIPIARFRVAGLECGRAVK